MKIKLGYVFNNQYLCRMKQNNLNFAYYESPLGGITIASDEEGLVGLWFDRQKYFGQAASPYLSEMMDGQKAECATTSLCPILRQTREWLDIYFTGRQPSFTPPLHLNGSSFRLAVWQMLLDIPYGQTTTYGELARHIACEQGRTKMSAQAVGGAVGHNPIGIIVPCHRVLGADGSLTGYAAGVEKKRWLLEMEGALSPGQPPP